MPIVHRGWGFSVRCDGGARGAAAGDNKCSYNAIFVGYAEVDDYTVSAAVDYNFIATKIAGGRCRVCLVS